MGKSIQAQAAAAIREELAEAFPGVAFRVKSRSGANLTAVDVKWIDGPCRPEVEKIVRKFEYGYFNMQTDSYEYSRMRDDLPQVKYVQCEREYSRESWERAIEAINKRFGYGLRLRAGEDGAGGEWFQVDPATDFHTGTGWASSRVWQELSLSV